MIIHKVLKYVMILLGVVAFGLLFYAVGIGDDAIKDNVDGVQSSTVVPFIYLGYAMLAIIILFVLIFTVLGLLRDPQALKKSLISIGILLVVVGIAYFVFADDSVLGPDKKPYILEDGEPLTPANSKVIDTALYTFYIIGILSVLSIVWAGVTKLIKK